MKDAASRANERFTGILESLADGFTAWDRDWRYTYVNAAAERMLGRRREELLGRDVRTMFPQEATELFHARYERAMADKAPVSFEAYHPPLDAWIEVRAFPSGDGLSVFFRDITERKRTQTVLGQSEQNFRSLAEGSPNMILTNCEGRIVYANAASEQKLGCTRDELCAPSSDILPYLSPGCIDLVRSRHGRALNGEDVEPIEITLQPKDGKRVETILSSRLIDYDRRKAILYILVDVTALKTAERLRIIQEKRLRRLAAQVAAARDEEQRRIAEGLHDDVAQLLTTCSIKLTLADKAGSSHELRTVHEEIGALLTEANDRIHSLSFELGAPTLYKLGIEEAIREVCNNTEARHGVHFDVHSTGAIGDLEDATATVLFKAVRELVFNVIAHAGVREASVSIARKDEVLEFAVEDCGRGFARPVEGSEAGSDEGLGLFNIRERLRELGGRMRIESRPGAGTRVALRVPVGKRSSVIGSRGRKPKSEHREP